LLVKDSTKTQSANGWPPSKPYRRPAVANSPIETQNAPPRTPRSHFMVSAARRER